MIEYTLSVCNRKNLCVDCNNEKCAHHGKMIADCPKYTCDREGSFFEDCESCDFLKQFQKDMRAEYIQKVDGSKKN